MYQQRSSFLVLVLVTIVLVIGSGGLINHAAADGLTLTPMADPAALTVSGEGVYIQRGFNAGETPWIPLVDDNGTPLPDGSYTYELRSIPYVNQAAVEEAYREGDEKRLAEIRRVEQAQVKVQSGCFEIIGGALVPHERGYDPAAPPE
jgi:hypothetical protein